ncbi:hypothetical protein V6Z11_A05G273700 [Gossypium hirsutum]
MKVEGYMYVYVELILKIQVNPSVIIIKIQRPEIRRFCQSFRRDPNDDSIEGRCNICFVGK